MSTTSENLQLWSSTAADNDDADAGISMAEGMDPGALNNGIRAVMATLRKYTWDTDGKLTAGGTADALTVTTQQAISNAMLADGYRIGVWAAGTNTVAGVTIAVDGLTAKTIKDAQGNALVVGAITTGMFLDLVYEAGAGVFHAMNINSAVAGTSVANVFTADQTIRSADAGAGQGPALTLDRNSASPDDNDLLGQLLVTGRNDAAQSVTYSRILIQATDVTDGTEDGKMYLQTIANGTITTGMTLEGTAVAVPGTLAVTGAASASAFTEGGTALSSKYQGLDAGLTAIAALANTDGNFIVGNGSAWVAESGATARTSLGVGTGDSPQFTAVNVGHASDTTLTRVSAGVAAIEGATIRTGTVGESVGGTGATSFQAAANNILGGAATSTGTPTYVVVMESGVAKQITLANFIQKALGALTATTFFETGVDRIPIYDDSTTTWKFAKINSNNADFQWGADGGLDAG